MIALGGGVVGDLAGFCRPRSCGVASASSRCRRACLPRSIPPSAAKTGINAPQGKNLIGALPTSRAWCLADTALLDTLPLREIRAGYAETVKYGLINDPDFFDWCAANWPGV